MTWNRYTLCLLVLVGVTAMGGCGGGAAKPAATSNSARQETQAEAAWRQAAQQFTQDLDAGLQALASTASTDAYQAVSNLGPLSYCSQNLAGLGRVPPVYQLAYGSLAAACEQLESGAQLWRSEVNSNGSDFAAAVFAVRRGSRLVSRAEQRLRRYQTIQPPLSGAAATKAEAWASPIALQWASGQAGSIQDALAQVDGKLNAGAADPIAALWAEHSGGAATTITACAEILDRFAKTPPNESTRHVSDDLHAACQALSTASDDSAGHTFDPSGYARAKAQLRRAINELETVAP
jgi:hypothetical protein